ncbi:MAG: efflux RND transporter periplasmic adaptor subunit [Bdellovibrio sp.]|nr:efflux RND transporter periplasmic adaptor subunit [Bdellovibrio sp.]
MRTIFLMSLFMFSICSHASEEAHHEDDHHAPSFKLSAEATKNFEVKTIKLSGKAPWGIPDSAVLYSGEEVNIYRLRKGEYQRIDFETSAKTVGTLKVKSRDLCEGDEVVTHGVGFLRAVDIVESGGAPEGHSH